MTSSKEITWGAYIQSLIDKPHADRTKDENFLILFAEIKENYEDISKPSDITWEIEEHYCEITNKEQTVLHREIFNLSEQDRRLEADDPSRPGKMFLQVKGDVIDRLCEILEIKKHKDFHSQIKHVCIYEEDIKKSEWYRYVLRYQAELEKIFKPLTIGKDFRENPTRFFKTFCFKVMGISCSLQQPKAFIKEEHEALLKQHMNKEDIYNKHYGGTPKAISKKRKLSDEWINKKLANGEPLTIAELKLRALRRHVEIHKTQPQYKRYLSNIENSILLKLQKKKEFKNSQQNRRTLG